MRVPTTLGATGESGAAARWVFRVVALLATVLFAGLSAAHEVRPAYLGLTELHKDRFALVWKVPQLGDMVLGLRLVLPSQCASTTPGRRELLGTAAVDRRIVDCAGGLAGSRIAIDGLAITMTDALARVEFLDGRVQTVVVKPAAPFFDVSARPSALDVARDYLLLGIEHILGGVDHLLFVLGLLLIVRGAGQLVATVTAFTIAHSVTLALATLGWARVPQAPVEAAIALSIVFVAAEILRVREGRETLTARAPWVVAFAFGLLHGFGFAGALAEVGLPQADIPLALFAFNVGVEMGQLLFVAAVLALAAVTSRSRARLPRWTTLLPGYAIGTAAMFWVVQRVAAF